ncbi:hypothetical protein [Natrinema sp. H-ect4]
MIGARDAEPIRCPDCDGALPERDPLIGWWLCDDCELAVDGDGSQIA